VSIALILCDQLCPVLVQHRLVVLQLPALRVEVIESARCTLRLCGALAAALRESLVDDGMTVRLVWLGF